MYVLVLLEDYDLGMVDHVCFGDFNIEHVKANVRVNFGPTFIIKPDVSDSNAVSEVDPMSPDDRKVDIVIIYKKIIFKTPPQQRGVFL